VPGDAPAGAALSSSSAAASSSASEAVALPVSSASRPAAAGEAAAAAATLPATLYARFRRCVSHSCKLRIADKLSAVIPPEPPASCSSSILAT
jgi:hypothetical protein